MKRLSLIATALLFFAVPAFARSVADVDVPETLSVEGKSLRCNGAGIRKKIIIQEYVVALYLESNSTDEHAIFERHRTWAVRMIFLRDVEKEKIVRPFEESFEKTSRNDAALQSSLDKVTAALTDVKKGTVMTVSYTPSKGTTVAVQSGPSVTIEGWRFGFAMLDTWIGHSPLSLWLKRELLEGK